MAAGLFARHVRMHRQPVDHVQYATLDQAIRHAGDQAEAGHRAGKNFRFGIDRAQLPGGVAHQVDVGIGEAFGLRVFQVPLVVDLVEVDLAAQLFGGEVDEPREPRAHRQGDRLAVTGVELIAVAQHHQAFHARAAGLAQPGPVVRRNDQHSRLALGGRPERVITHSGNAGGLHQLEGLFHGPAIVGQVGVHA